MPCSDVGRWCVVLSLGIETHMKSTVIIPTYHRPKELSDCLRSILAQTVRPDEVLVIDDGKLESWPLDREFQEAGIAYQGFRKEVPGLTASRNLGTREATGDIVFFVARNEVGHGALLSRSGEGGA